MSSLDRLEELRQRNKDLLKQLNQQREILERLSGGSHGRKRGREDGMEGRRDPAEVLTLTGPDRSSVRAALAKPTVRFADECESQAGIQRTISSPSLTSKHSRGASEHSTLSEHVRDSDRQPTNRLQDTSSTKSCSSSQSKEQREEHSSVTVQSDECEEISTSDMHHLPHLLGYDWIAGVLDAEDSLIERSDEFFNGLRTFRSLNRDECVHRPQAEFSGEKRPVLPPLTDKDDPEAHIDTHQCTFSYTINSRLFPVPLHHQECCPVCKKHKSSHPHTTAEPALIRVSIPRSTLLPPHQYKAHRRCSFNPSDSLGLPSHCLSGWSNKGQSALQAPSSLDLRSSLNLKSSAEAQVEDLPVHKESRSSIQVSEVSRLNRQKFRHFSPNIKVGGTSHP